MVLVTLVGREIVGNSIFEVRSSKNSDVSESVLQFKRLKLRSPAKIRTNMDN